MVLVPLFFACSKPPPTVPVPLDTDVPDTGPVDDTAVPVDTTPPLLTFDCGTVPAVPPPPVLLDAPRGSKDVAFDAEGWMIGSDGTNLVRARSATRASLHTPNLGPLQKLALLPDETLVAVGTGSVHRLWFLHPDGSRDELPMPPMYGVEVGPDGKLYVTSDILAPFHVYRVDPDTLAVETLLELDVPPRDLAFTRDGRSLLVGTLSPGVYALDFDEAGQPADTLRLVATVPGTFHDVIELDACGNLYIAAWDGTSMLRVAPDGTVQTLFETTTVDYVHGLEWGRGAGPWSELTAYLTTPNNGNRVLAWELGVPSARWPGELVGP
ncbi:MAG: SMP-30/gluconolactonase/LRE family protein [Myxococcota bacterium]